jgi:hypothetical protein
MVWVPIDFTRSIAQMARSVQRGAADREHDAFRQALAKQARPARADRDSNRHLRSRAWRGEEHGGEIGAGNEQDEPDRAKQDQKKRLHPADDLFLERINRRAKAVALRIVVR